MDYEKDSFEKHYEYLDWSANTEVTEVDGVETVFLLPGFRQLRSVLISLEDMGRKIEFDPQSVGFDITHGKRGKPAVVPKAKSTQYFSHLKVFLYSYMQTPRYVFSLHVEAVWEGLKEALEVLGFDPESFRFRELGYVERSIGKTHAAIFNEVVSRVAVIVSSSRFAERLRARERNAERNETKGLTIEQKVFENKSRQTVLMLHFGFQEPYRHSVTPEEIQKYRQKFFNNSRSNKLLQGICDYIWVLEEGDETGLHLHVLIFYRANSCRDVHIARMIGDYWVKVTGGLGQYWNSNAEKAFHAKYGHGVGTGVINWDEDAKREALRQNIRYMAKADQFLKAKVESAHTFGTSQVEEKKKLGRPRVAKSKGNDDVVGEVKTDSFDPASLDGDGCRRNEIGCRPE